MIMYPVLLFGRPKTDKEKVRRSLFDANGDRQVEVPILREPHGRTINPDDLQPWMLLKQSAGGTLGGTRATTEKINSVCTKCRFFTKAHHQIRAIYTSR
jgi:hypothetical protein